MRYYLGLVDEYEVPLDYDCYVWAGDFCVNGINWCIRNGKHYEIMSNLQYEYDDIHEIYLYLEQVKDKVISYLKNILNEYHKTDYNEYKWRILLNQWLSYYLPSMYDKYLTLKKISEDDRKYHVNLVCTDCAINVLDQLDFFNILRDDFGFHKYEYRMLLKYMLNIDNIEVTDLEEYRRIPLREYEYRPLPKHVQDFVDEYKKYKEKTGEPDEVVIQSSYIKFTLYKEIMEQKYGKISGYFTDYLSHIRTNMKLDLDLDVKWRRMERDILDESNEFVCLICKMICNFIPIAYVEEFDRLKKIALGNYRWGLKPKVVIYDVEGITINEIFKIYLMNIDIENTYKVDIQHSVAYNIGGYSWYNFMELHVCDEFLICNSMHNEMIPTKFTRMPFISFFRNNINQSESGNEIIYAAYVYPQHRGELAHVEWNWGKYISDELKFLKMLDKSVLSQFKYRKYPLFKNQWKVDERLKEEIPSIVFDEEPSFLKSINNAKLVISSLFGSAAMEAFAAGKPTIVLFNPKYSYVELNDNYKDVEDMIRVGIIAETPERLAHIVNSIHDDVESWWNEPERQGVVRRIREKYIYFPENAKEIWVEKITSYVD